MEKKTKRTKEERYENLDKICGSRIRQLRESRKIIKQGRKGPTSQDDLASFLHTDRWTIADIEKGQASLTFAEINKLCDLFQCDADYLLGRIDQKTKTATDICKATALTEAAANTLQILASKPDIHGKQVINCVNTLLEAVNTDKPHDSVLYDIYGYICSDFALVNDIFGPDMEGLLVRVTAPDGTSRPLDFDSKKQDLFLALYQKAMLEKLRNLANKKRNP